MDSRRWNLRFVKNEVPTPEGVVRPANEWLMVGLRAIPPYSELHVACRSTRWPITSANLARRLPAPEFWHRPLSTFVNLTAHHESPSALDRY